MMRNLSLTRLAGLRLAPWPPDTWISMVAWEVGARLPMLGLARYFSGEVAFILKPTALLEMFWIWILADNSPPGVVEKITSWAGLMRRISWLLFLPTWPPMTELPKLATLSAEGDWTMGEVTIFFLVSSLESEEERLSEQSFREPSVSRGQAASQ